MGGHGSGGSRSGSGRKKKATHLRGIDGGAGRRGDDQVGDRDEAPATEPAPIAPPKDLTPAELLVWTAWAPLAAIEGTLTASTLSAFVHLCEMEVDRRELRARYVPVRSSATGEVRSLLHMDRDEELSVRREHRTLLKDIKAAMKDFKLAPFGKELDGAGAANRQPDEDPLDAFTRRRG